MKSKINFKTLAVSILIPLAIGGLSALFTMGSMKDFEALTQPPLSPVSWLFPVVWTVLFIMMGIASYIAVETSSGADDKERAFKVYFLQLGFNFLWSIIFFTFGAYEIAFVWLAALLALIIITAVRFYSLNRAAGLLMLPYIAWVIFAGYLNIAIYLLNT